MPGLIEITVSPSFRDVAGKFVKANEELLNAKRDEMRGLGQTLVAALKSFAPRRSGAFAEGHSYKTFESGETIELRTYAPSPLAGWIIEGTPAHLIAARNARALSFFWERGPQGAGQYSFTFVRHPGTKPNPYQERALDSIRPEFSAALSRMTNRFVIGVTA